MHRLVLTITSTALISVYSDSLVAVFLCGFLLHASLGYMWNTSHNYGKKSASVTYSHTPDAKWRQEN